MKESQLHISLNHPLKEAMIYPPASKSEANRALILEALSNEKTRIRNLPDSSDTSVLKEASRSSNKEINVKDAGTALRFLTAYYAVGKQEKILKGTDRMHQRPIGELVNALRKMGADINYMGNEGFPPLLIKESSISDYSGFIELDGDVSSQFVSALLLIAPALPNGIKLRLTKQIVSKPYIDLTISMLSEFGLESEFIENEIIIKPQPFREANIDIGGDWSSASYWMAVVALSETGSLLLSGLHPKSSQGDKHVVELMKPLGIKSQWEGNLLKISKQEHVERLELNLKDHPDLVQSIAVVCAAKRIPAELSGIGNLRYKETDRIRPLPMELEKINTKLNFENNVLKVQPSEWSFTNDLTFDTYEDHRMAMSLATLAVYNPISIRNPKVVNKSYPGFWDDMKKCGVDLV